MKTAKHIPVLSFFTGGGFLDMGFEQAGFNVVWSNELNPFIAQMYSSGVSSWRTAQGKKRVPATIRQIGDVRSVALPEIRRILRKERKPRFVGIIGGPPCPDFSVAGRNHGSQGIHGQLTEVFINLIEQIKPDFLVLENVPGLYRTHLHRKFLEQMEHRLEVAQYAVDRKILNALEFGVPQDRSRLFVVAIRKRHSERVIGRRIKHGERGWFSWPPPKYMEAKTRFPWPGIVLRGEVAKQPHGVPLELTVGSQLNGSNPPFLYANSDEYFKPYSKKFKLTPEGMVKEKSFKRLHRYRYSPAACYGNNEVHLHPWEDRRISVREALRIQGVPDSYVLPADIPLTAKFKMIGNGVPVPLARAVAESVRRFLTVL